MPSTSPIFHSTKKTKPTDFSKFYERESVSKIPSYTIAKEVSHVIVPVTITANITTILVRERASTHVKNAAVPVELVN
jgi:hypothetical protein